MTDEREGLISASSLEQKELCPGSWKAQQGLPERESEFARIGTAIHAYINEALSGTTKTKLSDEHLDIAKECIIQREELIKSWQGSADPYWISEQRLWCRDETGKVCSAKVDFAAINGDRALIIEYKTLYGKFADSTINRQLMCQAVVLKDNYNVNHITVAMIQPAIRHKPTIANYGPEQLIEAKKVVLEICKRAYRSDRRTVGEKQCSYCIAAGTNRCPESIKNLEHMSMIEIHNPEHPCTNDDLAWLVDRAKACKKLIAWIESEAKFRLKSGQRLILKDGSEFVLGKDSKREKITDVAGVYESIKHHDTIALNQIEFISKCGLTKKGLTEYIRENSELKGKGLDEAIKDILFGNVLTTDIEPEIERKENVG